MNFSDPVINHSAVLDFLEFGICCPGETFFSSTPDNHNSFLRENLAHIANSDISINEAAERVYYQLEKAINDIVQSNYCSSFALSGGADSRLIFSILIKNHPHFLNNIYVYTRLHPTLNQQQDRDYLIAKKLCDQYSIALNPEFSSKHSSFYLVPQYKTAKKCLSGLWGGELLGGSVINHYLFSPGSIKQNDRDSNLCLYLLNSLNGNELNQDSMFSLFSLTLKKSQHTAFYHSLAWFSPDSSKEVTISPFLDHDFQKTLFSLPPSYLKDYQLYALLLEKKADNFLNIPINNFQIPRGKSIHHPREGIEPKNLTQQLNIQVIKKTENNILEKYIDQYQEKKYYPYLKNSIPYIHF